MDARSIEGMIELHETRVITASESSEEKKAVLSLVIFVFLCVT
jgi:hypothetical protein